MRIPAICIILALLMVAGPAAAVQADCPDNLLANPGFEGNTFKTENVGTSLSSNMVEGWLPWSVLGDATVNREVEYKVIDAAASGDSYRVYSGNQSQKFFTTWGTHTAGMYQRVRVPSGSRVVFSIWVQVYSGERELRSGGEYISDLEWPKDSDDKRGPGVYHASAGIDPQGNVPAAFGAPPSDATVWSQSVTEFETRRKTDAGVEYDAWVQLEVSTIAQGEWVTVYTRGMPEYAVKHNDSFWDEACLVALAPPTPTPRPTDPPTPTPEATETPVPTATPAPTDTPAATATPEPTATLEPTETPIPPTATPEATETALPADTPAPGGDGAPTETAPTVDAPTAPPEDAPAPTPTDPPPPLVPSAGTGALVLYAAAAVGVVAVLGYLVVRKE